MDGVRTDMPVFNDMDVTAVGSLLSVQECLFFRYARACPKFLAMDFRTDDPKTSTGYLARKSPLSAGLCS